MTRVVFAGTPEFACESLRALVESGVRPVAVLTQPDRPAGRGKKLRESAVKQYAREQGLHLMQPASLKGADILAELDALNADLFVVAAYGLLLPQSILDVPQVACVNVHGSLLPRWRGAAPIQAAILAGDKQTGISLMQMEAGLDTGPVYATSSLEIGATETAGELHDRLAALGGKLLVQHLGDIANGVIAPNDQSDDSATYAAKIRTDDARLDWSLSASELQRMVRAYNPVPGAWTTLDGERLKCWRAAASSEEGGTPGAILSASPEGIVIACGDGSLCLTELQRPGKTAITAAEFERQLELDHAVLV
jgi:methionyl-tRNA formyltransferase